MFTPEFPRAARQNRTRQAIAALVASGALILSGCSGSSGTEQTSKASTASANQEPTSKGQYKTTLRFFADGTAVSTVEPTDGGKTMATHYSCPGDGPHLQVSSHVDSNQYAAAAGSTQLIENSVICQDGKVTESDFTPHETIPFATTTTIASGN